jgi:hypothetical protein
MGEQMLATVAPRSAIVGTGQDPEPGLLPKMIVVYYEGNLYGAVNMVTFADRAMHAYYRLRDHYPTVAMMAVPRSQVVQAATLYPEHGRVEVKNAEQQVRLTRWLGLAIEDGDALARELRVQGVRTGAQG